MLTFRHQPTATESSENVSLKPGLSVPDFVSQFLRGIDFSPKPRDKIRHGPTFAVNINLLSKNQFFSKAIRDKIRNGKHGFEIMHKNVKDTSLE